MNIHFGGLDHALFCWLPLWWYCRHGRRRFHHAMDCTCSLCAKSGGLLAYVRRTALGVREPHDTQQTHRFTYYKLDHPYCCRCSIAAFREGAGRDGSKMTAVNLHSVADIDLSTLTITKLDGKSV